MLRGPLRSVSARITAGAVSTVLLIGGGSFWILQAFYRRQMIGALAESTTVHGKLVEQSLRHSMHTRSLALLAEMVRTLGDQKGVEKVMVLNKNGVVRFSSDPSEIGRTLEISDPTCAICHQTVPSARGRTVIFGMGEGTRVFRNVNPILNSGTCLDCHPSRARINGVLIVDYSMAGIQSSLEAGARKMWLSAVILALAITAVVIVIVRRAVLSRLRSLVRAVDSIEAGRLDTHVEVRGGDEISLLGRHLNRMATSLDQSLRDVKEREAFLDAVIDSAHDGIVVVDEDLHIMAANRAFRVMIGDGREAPAALPCQCADFCAGHDPTDCPARRTFVTGVVTHRLRTVVTPQGGTSHYEISASPLHGAAGRRQVIEVWRDITTRREIEAQLANSERLASLGLLASGLSHEINNPLASITACLDGLQRRLRPGEGGQDLDELPEYLSLIRGEVDRCRELTERLKLLRPSARQARGPVDVGVVIQQSLALVRFMAEQQGVTVEVDIAPDLAAVVADEPQLRQVVFNIVLNALQAIDGPGRVLVTARPDGAGAVVVEVTDSGRGIDPADAQRIFEPFFSRRADGRGSGLGLFITKIIVDQLGGSIAVESMPGRGTTVAMHLPAGGGLAAGVGG